MWCRARPHDRIPLYPVQQIPRATAPPGRLRRPGLRPQPARPPRVGADTAPSRAATRGTAGNRRRSHSRSGRTVSVAARCGTARSRNPAWHPRSPRLDLSKQDYPILNTGLDDTARPQQAARQIARLAEPTLRLHANLVLVERNPWEAIRRFQLTGGLDPTGLIEATLKGQLIALMGELLHLVRGAMPQLTITITFRDSQRNLLSAQ